MKCPYTTLALPCLLIPAVVMADDFDGFSMDFVDITGGSVADNTGYGAVGYDYRMGKYEVSRGMIDSYNANSGGPAITMFDLTGFGGNGVNRAATGVNWNEAARFVNWLNTSRGYSPAYKFTTGGANDNIALWTAGDAGYDSANPFRNSQAYYFLPSEDEWYRAAYYDPSKNGGTGGYWDYATGSDTPPTPVLNGTDAGTAVYGQAPFWGPTEIMITGGLSPYGTMAQNGNVFEWCESGFTAPNDSAGKSRVYRGGYLGSPQHVIVSSWRNPTSPETDSDTFGFRVASVPEPPSITLGIDMYAGVLIGPDQIGQTLQVEYSSSLDSESWQPLGDPFVVPAEPSPFVVIDFDSPSHSRRFYRATVTP